MSKLIKPAFQLRLKQEETSKRGVAEYATPIQSYEVEYDAKGNISTVTLIEEDWREIKGRRVRVTSRTIIDKDEFVLGAL